MGYLTLGKGMGGVWCWEFRGVAVWVYIDICWFLLCFEVGLVWRFSVCSLDFLCFALILV